MIKPLASALLISVSLTTFPHETISGEKPEYTVIGDFMRHNTFDHNTAQSVINYLERQYEASDKVTMNEAVHGGYLSQAHYYFLHSWGTAEREGNHALSDQRKTDDFNMIKEKMDAAKAANDLPRLRFWALVTWDLWERGVAMVYPGTDISYSAPHAAAANVGEASEHRQHQCARCW
jgi:hypothetical protein